MRQIVGADRPISVQSQSSQVNGDGVAGCSPDDIKRASLRIAGPSSTHTLVVRSGCVDGCRTNSVAWRDTKNWRRRGRKLVVEDRWRELVKLLTRGPPGRLLSSLASRN